MDEVLAVLRQNDAFVLVGHRDPDGDSLGSSLALGLGLEQLGKKVAIISADPPFAAYRRLAGSERIVETDVVPAGYPVAIVMECNGIERTGVQGLEGLTVVNVDHHANNPDYGDVNWVDPDVAATGVMIFRLLRALEAEITPTIATHIYVAILTDTGSFRYSNTDATAFAVAAELLDCGVDAAGVAEAIYENVAASKVKLLARGLGSLVLEADGAIASMALPYAALFADTDRPDTEGIVNHAQAIEGVSAAVLLKEVEKGRFRVSMRSDGRIDVAEIAAAFDGGGHPRAAGCMVEGNLDDARELIVGSIRAALEAAGESG